MTLWGQQRLHFQASKRVFNRQNYVKFLLQTREMPFGDARFKNPTPYLKGQIKSFLCITHLHAPRIQLII